MSKTRHILIVDDEEDIIDLILSRLLLETKNDFQPLVAADGFEALEHMRTKDIAVVVLDLQMRHMDGMSVCRQASADEKLKNIPIIISSGFLGDDNKKLLKDMGINHFMPKPYKLNQLMEMISEVAHST